MDDQNKNLILATVLSTLVIVVWFIIAPPEQPEVGLDAAQTGSEQSEPSAQTPPATLNGSQQDIAASPVLSRETVLAKGPRIDIETAHLSGSISLTGGRLDDLSLTEYHETLAPDSPLVTLLSPFGSENAYYALHGWARNENLNPDQVPGANTLWGIENGEVLSEDAPVTLVWDNGAGLIFRRKIEVDENYMFTITQSVENTGSKAHKLQPYGLIARHGEPDTTGFFILHEGVIAMSDGTLSETNYDEMLDFPALQREGANTDITDVTQDGWIGFTDKYWMTTLIPSPDTGFQAVAKYVPGAKIYQTETRLPTLTVPPGETAEITSRFFAGAKEWEIIRDYESQGVGVPGFIDSIDWGWFFFLTKPIFAVLHWLNSMIGNMGWSIIVLTLLIKALMFPLAYKSYVSMARMKELQPEMEKIKEKAGDDRQKLQMEMMELYKKEKVNPAAGCLPILLQIPIFFSLYKVIFVTIELRHAPWIGWIRDLSAPDPSSILNLFGLLPFAAPEPGSVLFILSLGVLPIILGVSMWLQQKLNPAPTDPAQAMVFAWMPWVFMFMLGSFASGLVLYWIANNIITFTQQYVIMRSQGYTPDIFGNIKSSFKRRPRDNPDQKK